MKFTVYDTTTGAIFSAGECIESDVPLQARRSEDHAVLAGVMLDARQFYIVNGEPTPRPIIYPQSEAEIVGDGLDELVIEEVPGGTAVYLDGKEIGAMNDGTLVYASIEPGEHFLGMRPPFPHQEQTIRVTVT